MDRLNRDGVTKIALNIRPTERIRKERPSGEEKLKNNNKLIAVHRKDQIKVAQKEL